MEERRAIVEGISAAVCAAFEMGLDEAAARAQLGGILDRFGVAGDVTVLDDVAANIGRGPQYPVGHPMAPAVLNAQLAARELIERHAAEIRDQDGPDTVPA